MKEKKRKNIRLCMVILLLILFSTGCLKVFSISSNIDVIPKGKGIYAPGFKTGTYTDFSEKPGKVRIIWDMQSKEYEIQTKEQEVSRFRLIKLRRKYYLLQSKEEDRFNFAVIKVHKDTVDFLNIKKDHEEKLKELLKKHGLEVDEEDNVRGTREGLVSFFKDLVKKKHLESGEKLRYLGKE
jgi:hypothetical protein